MHTLIWIVVWLCVAAAGVILLNIVVQRIVRRANTMVPDERTEVIRTSQEANWMKPTKKRGPNASAVSVKRKAV